MQESQSLHSPLGMHQQHQSQFRQQHFPSQGPPFYPPQHHQHQVMWLTPQPCQSNTTLYSD
eukprot:1310023-Ditylum_brightwellii.AAC.1